MFFINCSPAQRSESLFSKRGKFGVLLIHENYGQLFLEGFRDVVKRSQRKGLAESRQKDRKLAKGQPTGTQHWTSLLLWHGAVLRFV